MININYYKKTTPQFGKKTIGISTQVQHKLVKNYKKQYEFFNTSSTQFQHYHRGCYLVNLCSHDTILLRIKNYFNIFTLKKRTLLLMLLTLKKTPPKLFNVFTLKKETLLYSLTVLY